YGLDKIKEKDQQVLVFDLGAGTLDVMIMNFGQGVFEVIATSGDTQLGGTDMDNTLINHLADEFKREQGIDIRKDKMATQRLKEAAEKAKIELSSTLETEVNLPFITADAQGPKHLLIKLTRAKLEELVRPTVDRCRHPLEQAIADAKLTPADIDKVIMVGGPTRMPIIQKFMEDYIGKKIERGVDPMECVAKGAAIQGAVLAGEVKDVLLLDVTPLTLGIETLGGVSTPLIDRNTTVPTSKSQVFSTAGDNQTTVEIHVLQGERPMAADNRTLGRFMLDGIPPSPRGVPQVEVIFDIDANGILTVTAKDKATNKSQNIVIKDSSALSKDDIEKMKKEAEMFAAEDRKRKELIDLRNQADTVIYTAEKALRDAGDLPTGQAGKVPADVKKVIEEKVAAVKTAKDGNDTALLKKALDELGQEISKIGQAMYGSGGATKDETTKQPNNKDNEEGPIEGEVVK
ncbi:Hsp70 family protein, partial [Candidatus Peregrinibacteria bacterium]|nr:Hsp70 family protein [Candidatus Peregrinibacteria bacterium]